MQKGSGYARQRLGPKLMNRCTEARRRTWIAKSMGNVKTNLNGKGSCQECERMEKLKGKKEGSPGRSAKKASGESLRWEVSYQK